MSADPTNWWIYRGGRPRPLGEATVLPPAPPWRSFDPNAKQRRGADFLIDDEQIAVVNAAIVLRRPLLVTGQPGTGKTTLAFSIARELAEAQVVEPGVLQWPITSRTTLQDGLYRYDAVARLQDVVFDRARREAGLSDAQAEERDIGSYFRLGPLGTALLPSKRPRVLLIDEIDKSDIDLPNDLLHIFEEGTYTIPELARMAPRQDWVAVETDHSAIVEIERGQVHCEQFPIVILTSNGERDFPPAFLRRCLRLEFGLPSEEQLTAIVRARLKLSDEQLERVRALIADFVRRRDEQGDQLSNDQLLNAAYLALSRPGQALDDGALREALFRSLSR